MTTPSEPVPVSQMDAMSREARSTLCKQAEHRACVGYYPPGADTFLCQCICHDAARGWTRLPDGGVA